jgi:RNA polymerase sigma factor (TIGR02999 family)
MTDSADGPSRIEVTQLLKDWGNGDGGALEKLAPLVQNELHRLAHRYMSREKPGHTLQSTALVNEVYLRLVDMPQMSWQDRAHFFAISARMMRRILTDFAGRAITKSEEEMRCMSHLMKPLWSPRRKMQK